MAASSSKKIRQFHDFSLDMDSVTIYSRLRVGELTNRGNGYLLFCGRAAVYGIDSWRLRAKERLVWGWWRTEGDGV